jgi:hypothetical protein
MAAGPLSRVLSLCSESATIEEFKCECMSATSDMPEGTVIRQHFKVTEGMVSKMGILKATATHVHLHERFADTGDLFLLSNDVYLTWRMTTPGRIMEWILKETDISDQPEKKINYVITKGETAIMDRLKNLFHAKGRKWNDEWVDIQQVGERTISSFSTERFISGANPDVWLDIVHWDLYGNEGLYAILTASIVPSSFDYGFLSRFFGVDHLVYAPSRVIASLVHLHRSRKTAFDAILDGKPYCIEARRVLAARDYAINSRFDEIHKFTPFPDFE